jgi:hypothetical protein
MLSKQFQFVVSRSQSQLIGRCLMTQASPARKDHRELPGLENEPNEPIVKSEIPGPNSKVLMEQAGKVMVNITFFNFQFQFSYAFY